MQTTTNQTPKWLDLFITAFGTQGLIALAWWAGAFHAQRIRELQATYPILQITGGAGVGKSTLVANLWKLAGSSEDENISRATHSIGALLAMLSTATNRPVVIEGPETDEDAFNWNTLRGCYEGGDIGVRMSNTPVGSRAETVHFHGALAFVGGNDEVPLYNRRLVNIHLQRQPRTDAHRAAVQALYELQIGDFCDFINGVRENREQVIYRLGHVPAYTESLRTETAPGLCPGVARNHAQLLALLDVLHDLFHIPTQVLHHAHTEVCGMAWVHADSKPAEATTTN